MATCSACGACCDPVWYSLGPADVRQSAVTTGAEDLVFAAAHWHPTGRRNADGMHAYACDRFDPVSRLCTAHDTRPPICRAYPVAGNLLPEPCAYRADPAFALGGEGDRPVGG
jgi:Fe-S-cluster containining protein